QNINNYGRGIKEDGKNHDKSSNSDYEPDDNSESEDNYYEINEEHNILQDWC
ncbi:4439_t:CDS:1, partial [Funneliformis caledonium]